MKLTYRAWRALVTFTIIVALLSISFVIINNFVNNFGLLFLLSIIIITGIRIILRSFVEVPDFRSSEPIEFNNEELTNEYCFNGFEPTEEYSLCNRNTYDTYNIKFKQRLISLSDFIQIQKDYDITIVYDMDITCIKNTVKLELEGAYKELVKDSMPVVRIGNQCLSNRKRDYSFNEGDNVKTSIYYDKTTVGNDIINHYTIEYSERVDKIC